MITVEPAQQTDRTRHVDLTDEAGVVHASVEKVVYIRRKTTGAGEKG